MESFIRDCKSAALLNQMLPLPPSFPLNKPIVTRIEDVNFPSIHIRRGTDKYVDYNVYNALWSLNRTGQAPSPDIVSNYHRSRYDPELLIKPLIDGMTQFPIIEPPEFYVDVVSKAFKSAENVFFSEDNVLLDIEEVKMPGNSLAGYGYTGLRGEPDNLKKASEKYAGLTASYAQHGYNVTYATPYIGLVRTQLVDEDDKSKSRLVWAISSHWLINSTRIFYNYYERARHNTFMSFGNTIYDNAYEMSQLLTKAATYLNTDASCLTAYCIDWTSFDFGGVKTMPISGTRYIHGVNVFELRYIYSIILKKSLHLGEEAVLLVIMDYEYILHRPIVINGSLYYVLGTIPSGHYATYLLDTVINYTRIFVILNLLGINDFYVKVGGDDSVVVTGVDINWHSFSTLSFAVYGTFPKPPTSKLKTNLSELVEYHGHTSTNMVPTRDEVKVLALLLYPERRSYKDTVEDIAITKSRVLGLYIDTGSQIFWIKRLLDLLDQLYPNIQAIESDGDYILDLDFTQLL